MNRLARNRAPLPQSRLLTLTLAVSTALASLSAQAGVEIAQQPLLIAETVPPNVMLLLDDSGSMAYDYMCTSSSGLTASGCRSNVGGAYFRSYTRNGLSYNPAVTYKPWANADGSMMADANKTAASSDNAQLTGSTTNLWTTNNNLIYYRDFWVPTDIAIGDPHTMSGNTPVFDNNNLKRWVLGRDSTYNPKAWRCPGNSTGDPPQNGSNNSQCTPVTSLTWIDKEGVEFTRTVAQEWQNYANWYHYYRTRAKMAKGAISHAFATLDEGFRVGYNLLNATTRNYNIPVATSGGLFRGSNKETFYTKLHSTPASGGTPTRTALRTVGEYFKRTDSGGPWGPEADDAQITCRRNFTIVTTDGGWNDSFNDSTIGNADNIDGPQQTGVNGNTYSYSAVAPYRDKQAPNTANIVTLADVAMYYWKNDLRTESFMVNNVPITLNNPAFWQHMQTFTISIGQYGSVKPEDVSPTYPLNWGTPSAQGDDSEEKTDDLLHAAVNGRGEFFVASDPEEFSESLVAALNTIANELKYEASGGANSTEVKGGAKTFFSRYTSGTWHGDIVAYSVNETTGLQDQTAPLWEAESQLPAWDSRNIHVNVDGTAQPFLYSNLSGAQRTHLSSELVDYLRGDRSKEEDGTLRKRAGVLPAFINSQLVYVAAPTHSSLGNLSFTGAGAYAAYATAQQDRKSVIYIAGNNGMLHAFDADNGKEIYAFLPNFSISAKLSDYADKSYGDDQVTAKPHQYILDGELTVADAYLDGAWKTILVGTQGRGGSGIFALDVTDPNNIEFLWEKSAADNNVLGNNLGKPIIAQVANQDWRVILGNGPNSTGDKAQLLMFDLGTGAITSVDTGVNTNNGLAAVNPWDSDKDGFFDTAYAGDLQGNVWRFRNLATSPTVGKLFSGDPTRPITAMPLVVRNLKTGATWVYVGTGQYLNKDDLQNTDTQAWYGLIDNGTEITSQDQLKKSEFESSVVGERVLKAATEWDIIGGATPKRGWVIEFSLDGERMMTPNSVRSGVLIGFTFTPNSSDPCNPSGSSSLWAVNPFSGGRTNQGIFDTDGDGDPDQITIDGVSYFLTVMDGLPPITSGTPPSMSNRGSGSGSGSGHEASESDPKKPKICYYLPTETFCHNEIVGQIGRQSWREIIN